MLIIGEKLNSSIPRTLEALNNHDEDYLVQLIKAQAQAGADYLDINTALCGEQELTNMLWLIDLVQAHSKCDLMLDSPSPAVLRAAVAHVKGRKIIFNSVTVTERWQELTDVIVQYQAGVVVLPIKDAFPHSVQQRVENAKEITNILVKAGVSPDKIYIDALAETLSTADENAKLTLDTIGAVKQQLPQVQTTCGLSNISFGLPKRAQLNTCFLAMAVYAGLDSAILDITSPSMQLGLRTALAMTGQDEYCMDYISYIREMQDQA